MKRKTIAHYLVKELNPYHDQFIFNQMGYLKKYKPITIGPFRQTKRKLVLSHSYCLSNLHMQELITAENIVAIHAHHGGQALKILPLCEKYQLPLIVSIRGRDGSIHKSVFERNKQRVQTLLKHPVIFFPVCHFLAENLRILGVPKEKIKVLYGGVDLATFRYQTRSFPKRGEVRILSVGRLVMKKGFGTLIEAFARLHRAFPNTTLHIIGYGWDRKEIEELIKKHRLSEVVKLRGKMKITEIEKEMRKAHLFCLASQIAKDGDIEGIPNVLKEAMASGLPVVSTPNGGITELITHKETGYLAPEKSVEGLVKGLSYFLENPTIWKKYSSKARKTIEDKFDLQKQIELQEKYYDELLS